MIKNNIKINYNQAIVYMIVTSIAILIMSCGGSNSGKKDHNASKDSNKDSLNSSGFLNKNQTVDNKRQLIKLSHHINTSANEYLPVLSADENKMYFSAMDRTGFFDFKLDYTIEKSAGGEDIFISNMKDGIWEDARPVNILNTNGHEVVTQVFNNGDLLITGNYPEKLGPKNGNKGAETTDLFLAKLGSYFLN